MIFTLNYGEAGAVDRFGPALGLPGAYSGHNGYWDWGPPPDRRQAVIVVGLRDGDVLRDSFRGCALAARVDNHAGVENDELGAPVWRCVGPRRPWSELWPSLRHLG